ncbi:MAG: SRPBCC family protein [Kineosporiaceae bacterium]
MRLLARCRVRRTIDVAAPAGQVWAVLVDWPRHGAWVPLTTVRTLTPSGLGLGARFVGRTAAPGPLRVLGFDDVMEVVAWQPPEGGATGRCEVVKLGRVVRGGAEFEVEPLDAERTRVHWVEDVVVPRPLVRPVAVIAGWGLDRVLRAMARDIEHDRENDLGESR